MCKQLFDHFKIIKSLEMWPAILFSVECFKLTYQNNKSRL